MRLRTCNNHRRARERQTANRASLKRVWIRSETRFLLPALFPEGRPWTDLDAAWLIDTLNGGRILSMPTNAELIADLNAYGISGMKDGNRIAPEDLYMESQS